MPEELESTTPEKEIPEAPKVENPEGVLKKNEELLEKLKAEKKEREAFRNKVADFEKKEADAERKRLERKEDWETMRTNLEKERDQGYADRDSRYNKLFENSARSELGVAVGKFPLIDPDPNDELSPAEKLTRHLLYEIKATEENDRVVWRKIATDEEIKLHEYIASRQGAYGELFKADNNPGGDAPGNNGKVVQGQKKRSQMTVAEKSAFVTKHGQAAFNALPN